MGASSESQPPSSSLRRSRRSGRRLPRRAAVGRRTFAATNRALQGLAEAGAQVSVHVADIDGGEAVYTGDDHVSMPIADLGTVAVLIEAAAAFEEDRLSRLTLVERGELETVTRWGFWRTLRAPTLPLEDLAVLVATTNDPLAANALLCAVGPDTVRARIQHIGLRNFAVMDRFRDARGLDDAPHPAVGSTRELAQLFAALVNTRVVSPAVSVQVAEWLSLGHDLSLVGAATGLDPFAHEHDEHGLLFLNKTGRDRGVRAEAGVLAGPRAGLSYALTVCFDDLSIGHRLRVHDAFRTLGLELMEYAF